MKNTELFINGCGNNRIITNNIILYQKNTKIKILLLFLQICSKTAAEKGNEKAVEKTIRRVL